LQTRTEYLLCALLLVVIALHDGDTQPEHQAQTVAHSMQLVMPVL